MSFGSSKSSEEMNPAEYIWSLLVWVGFILFVIHLLMEQYRVGGSPLDDYFDQVMYWLFN